MSGICRICHRPGKKLGGYNDAHVSCSGAASRFLARGDAKKATQSKERHKQLLLRELEKAKALVFDAVDNKETSGPRFKRLKQDVADIQNLLAEL